MFSILDLKRRVRRTTASTTTSMSSEVRSKHSLSGGLVPLLARFARAPIHLLPGQRSRTLCLFLLGMFWKQADLLAESGSEYSPITAASHLTSKRGLEASVAGNPTIVTLACVLPNQVVAVGERANQLDSKRSAPGKPFQAHATPVSDVLGWLPRVLPSRQGDPRGGSIRLPANWSRGACERPCHARWFRGALAWADRTTGNRPRRIPTGSLDRSERPREAKVETECLMFCCRCSLDHIVARRRSEGPMVTTQVSHRPTRSDLGDRCWGLSSSWSNPPRRRDDPNINVDLLGPLPIGMRPR